MASAPPHPPVPKPRANKPHPPPQRPPPPRLHGEEESSVTTPKTRSPDVQAISSEGPSPQPHLLPHPSQTLSSRPISITPEADNTVSGSSSPLQSQADYEEPVSLTGQSPMPAGPTPDPAVDVRGRTEEDEEGEDSDSDEEHPYADIDSRRRHSDYANVDMLSSDSDDLGDDDQSSPRISGRPKYAPSIKLSRHPLLKKSVSNSEVDGTPNMVELMKAAKKPKNRAPPPPPGSAKLSPRSGMGTRHKRSQSDVHSEGQRSRDGVQRSPIPEHVVSNSQSHRSAPNAPNSSGRTSRPSSQPSPKSVPSQDRITPQTGQTRSHPPIGRVPPPPSQHRAAPGRSLVATAAGGKPKGSIPSHPPPPTGGRPKSFTPSHPPPPAGPAPPGPSRVKVASVGLSQHVNMSGKGKGVGQSQDASHDPEHRSLDQEQASPSTKPKRHAPPPPMGGAMRKTPTSSPETRRRKKKEPPPPAYAEVMKAWKNRPPKPTRLHRTRSLEGLCDLSDMQDISSSQDTVTSPVDVYEEILKSMDLLTIELRKDGDQDAGISLVNGRIRSGRGMMVEGVFVEEVVADSPASLDGRVQAGDMLIELYGHAIRGGSYQEATQLLEMPSGSVRLKIGRPDITSSVFSLRGDHEEPLYVNQLVGPDQVAEVVVELQEKLERTRLKAQEFEREKELTVKQMDVLREEFEKEKELAAKQLETLKDAAEQEKEELEKEVQELREAFDQYQRDSEEKTSELSLTLATVTVSKTKAENELDGHKETLEILKHQLEEEKSKAEKELETIKKDLMDTENKLKSKDSVKTKDFESRLLELQTELSKQKEGGAKMAANLTGERKRVAELEERLKATESEVKVEKALNDRLQQTIDNQALQISKLKLEVEQLQNDLNEANSKTVSSSAREPLLQAKPPRPLPSTASPKSPEQSPSPQVHPSSSNSDHRPVSALSEEDIKIHENGEVSSEDDLDRDDAFDKNAPSPHAPCPYIDFVPLQLDGKPSEAEGKSKEAKGPPESAKGAESVKEVELSGKEMDDDVGGDSVKVLVEKESLPADEKVDGEGKEEEEEKEEEGEKKEEEEGKKDEEMEEEEEEPVKKPAEESTFDIIISAPDVAATGVRETGDTDTADVSTTEDASQEEAAAAEEKEEEKSPSPVPAKEDDTAEEPVPPEESVLAVSTEKEGDEGKGEDGKGDEVKGAMERGTVAAGEGTTELTPETKGSEVVAKEESQDPFDAIKSFRKLDTSVAMYRSRMGGTINRKQPSKSHLKKMASSGDILDNVPKELLCSLDKPLDDGSPVPQEPEAQLPRAASVDSKDANPPTPQPKPRPRAAPRKKQQPSPDEATELKKTPQAAPRAQTQTADNLEAMRSPKDRVSSEKSSGSEKSPPAADESPKHPVVNGTEKISPAKAPKPSPSARAPHVGPKPSPRVPEKPPAKDPISDTAEDRVSPSHSRTTSLEKEPDVDPSKLSVKEKALLAQKVLISTPERPKPGPPRVARKPKTNPGTPVLSPETLEEGASVGSRIRRAQSVEEEFGESPQHKKRLPPGAISMFGMGAVPMFGLGGRATVSASDPIGRERRDSDRASPGPKVPEGEEGTDAPSEQQSPFRAVQILPVKPSPSDSGAELDDSASPQVPTKFEHKDSDINPTPTAREDGGAEVEFAAEVDYDQVLTWTPEVTASWLGQVGLGSHGQTFVEKGIHGYLLFDMDGHKLKGMGVVSHDDRAVFKKEVKNLKPFADKQKKLLEKQRKEEKKNAKKKKK